MPVARREATLEGSRDIKPRNASWAGPRRATFAGPMVGPFEQALTLSRDVLAAHRIPELHGRCLDHQNGGLGPQRGRGFARLAGTQQSSTFAPPCHRIRCLTRISGMNFILAQATSGNEHAGFLFGLGAFGLTIALLLGLFWFWMLVDALTNTALDTTMRLVWAAVIFFLPFLGALAYLFVGRKRTAA
jgi:hypothetical protein